MINYPTIILPNPTAHCAGPFPLGIRPSEALFAGLKARFGRRPLLLLVRTLFEVLLTRSPRPFGVALLTLSLVPSKASDGIRIRIARRPFAICAVQGKLDYLTRSGRFFVPGSGTWRTNGLDGSDGSDFTL